MWKRNKQEDYRSLMDSLNQDANNITMQLDTIATPRVSALDGGNEQLQSRNSFLESKRQSVSRHGSAGPGGNYYDSGGTTRSSTAGGSSRRSVGAMMNPMNLFGNTVLPKEIQLRGDAVSALNKVAQLLADKNTPPHLELSLLDKGYQLIESLRTSRERINRKHIKKGSYLTLMSALDKRSMGNNNNGRGGKGGGRTASISPAEAAMLAEAEQCNPWSRVIEQSYWWPHHIHSVMGRIEERAFESREPSPVPTSKSLCMEDPLMQRYNNNHSITTNNNNNTANHMNGGYNTNIGSYNNGNSNNYLMDSRSVSMPANDYGGGGGGGGYDDPHSAAGSPENKNNNNNALSVMQQSNRAVMDSFSDLFIAQTAPTCADVPTLFYDESDLAMHALEMISDEEMKHNNGGGGGNRGGGDSGVRLTGTKKNPAVVSEEYNQGLREHFIHAVHSTSHPMANAIDAFLRYNASAILRISLPDSLNVQPTGEAQIEMWDVSLLDGSAAMDNNNSSKTNENNNNGGNSVVGSVVMTPIIRGGNGLGLLGRPQTPTHDSPNFLGVGSKGGARRGGGSSGSPPAGHHHDPLRGASLSVGGGKMTANNGGGGKLTRPNSSPSMDASNSPHYDPTTVKSIWGIVPSSEYEKQFLRDRLQFIQALCETVLDRMFSDKHIPVVVTSTHVDGQNARSIDNMSPVKKSRGGRAGGGGGNGGGDGTASERSVGGGINLFGGGGGGNTDRNSADGSVASSIRPSSSATYAGAGGNRRRTAIDLSFPFTEVLPEIIDSKLELLAVRSIFRWAEGFEANRRRNQSEDDIEAERMKIGAMTPGLIKDTSSRLLLEGTACKFAEFLKSISDGIVSKDLIFVDEMYDRLIDALMITYNIAETSRVKMPGTHVGADDIFPCIVYIIGTSRCAFLVSALLRWTSTSTVACRLPPFLSKGVEAYVLQSFTVAANAVVDCIMRQGNGY